MNLSLLDGFQPVAGESFTLFEGAVGSISGTFSSVVAPVFNGYTIDVAQNGGLLTLQVVATPLPGDHNRDGIVDAADYIIWRRTPSAFGGAAGYDSWRANFGAINNNGASFSTSVPEPTTLVLIAVAGLTASYRVSRTAASRFRVSG